MKNIQTYEQINEAKTQLVDFQVFVDFLTMNKKDFNDNYSDAKSDPGFMVDLKNVEAIGSKCKIEVAFQDDIEDGYNLSKMISKAKYKNVFVFSHDIGVATIYFISSEYPDLPKRIDMTTLE